MIELILNLLSCSLGLYIAFRIKGTNSFKLKLSLIYIFILFAAFCSNFIFNVQYYNKLNAIAVLLLTFFIFRQLKPLMSITKYHKSILSSYSLDTLPSLIWIKDVNNRYTYINNEALNLLFKGVSRDEVLGKTSEGLVYYIHKKLNCNYNFTNCETDCSESFKTIIKYGYINNDYVALRLHNVPVYINKDGKQKLECVISIGNDITQECVEHREMLELFETNDTTRLKDHLLKHITHLPKKSNVPI